LIFQKVKVRKESEKMSFLFLSCPKPSFRHASVFRLPRPLVSISLPTLPRKREPLLIRRVCAFQQPKGRDALAHRPLSTFAGNHPLFQRFPFGDNHRICIDPPWASGIGRSRGKDATRASSP